MSRDEVPTAKPFPQMSLLILSDKMIEIFWFPSKDMEIMLQSFNEVFSSKEKVDTQGWRVMDLATLSGH